MLTDAPYPVYHLDFETVQFAVPMVPNPHPYEQIPFQWSVHVDEKDGTIRQEEYLDDNPKGGREELTVRLIQALGKTGTICIYSSFEKTVLSRLAQSCPGYQAELEQIIARSGTSAPCSRPITSIPALAGATRSRAVLPALMPALHYENLAIQHGSMASHWYAEMISGTCTAEWRATIREALLRYCARDTEGLLELRRYLTGC